MSTGAPLRTAPAPRTRSAGRGPPPPREKLPAQARQCAAEGVQQQAEAHLVPLPGLLGRLPGRRHLGLGPGGAAVLVLGALPLAVPLGDDLRQPLVRAAAQQGDGAFQLAAGLGGGPQGAALLGDLAAQLLVLGLAFGERGACLLPGLGQLGAHPLELDGQLVHPRKRLVPFGPQLGGLPAAGDGGDRDAGTGRAGEHGRGRGRQRLVRPRPQLTRPVLVPPGDDGRPERRGVPQLRDERGATEAGPLGRGEPGEAAQAGRDVRRGHPPERGRGHLGEAGAHGVRQHVPVRGGLLRGAPVGRTRRAGRGPRNGGIRVRGTGRLGVHPSRLARLRRPATT
ncbi:hypothetical protein WBK50_19845 [Pseudonocardia sp. T1-2H]|uniref:hypothetical protein n=1 Tax=Pseudonocardia sp. T1-2H TaxID=3128899 RepID=UPI003101434C